MSEQNGTGAAAVYVQTNAADGNEVLAFERGADGGLRRAGASPPAVAAPARRTSPPRARSS
jgi:hypothetical protein